MKKQYILFPIIAICLLTACDNPKPKTVSETVGPQATTVSETETRATTIINGYGYVIGTDRNGNPSPVLIDAKGDEYEVVVTDGKAYGLYVPNDDFDDGKGSENERIVLPWQTEAQPDVPETISDETWELFYSNPPEGSAVYYDYINKQYIQWGTENDDVESDGVHNISWYDIDLVIIKYIDDHFGENALNIWRESLPHSNKKEEYDLYCERYGKPENVSLHDFLIANVSPQKPLPYNKPSIKEIVEHFGITREQFQGIIDSSPSYFQYAYKIDEIYPTLN